MRASGARPVVVIDDTDKFADPDGAVDEASVDGLFDNAIRLLADLQIDFVVAVHPRFQPSAGYRKVADKFLHPRLAIPFLPIEQRFLVKILDGHLRARDIEGRAADFFEPPVIDTLQGTYGAHGRDLRYVLHLAHRAAAAAYADNASVVTLSHLGQALRDGAMG
jgi:Cdc6-like AAA superfamily ATPase